MARNEQLIRQLRLLQLLEQSRYGRRLEELRDDLVDGLGLTKLSERTVRRDLEALQAAGFDVDTQESERGTVWKLGPSLRGIPKIEASVTELLALSMVRDLLVPLTGTSYWQGLETLWQKMQDSLPEPVWRHFDRRRHLVVRGTPQKNYADHQGIIASLNRGIEKHRVVEIEYRSRDQAEPSRREVEPLALAFYRGSLYLIARACDAPPDSAIRHYKLDRFTKATPLDKYFQPPTDFDPDEHFNNSMGVYKASQATAFRIRLAGHVVAWVSETPWHGDQTIDWQDDGTAILFIPSAYEEEIIPRVLSLAEHAQVLEPESCRQALANIVKQLHESYQQAPLQA